MTLLMIDFSPHYSAFWSILAVVGCSWMRKATRMYPRDVWHMLVNGGRNMAIVALACAGASMFVACLTVTGVVISLSSAITSLAAGNIFIAGTLLMVTTLILGMGVPTTAAYVIGAAIGAPILQQLGVPLLQAHMFVFYFSILADATPPVSVASYAAASIARAGPMATGMVAARLAMAGFVVGYSYLYTPALLMQGPRDQILSQFLVVTMGLTLVAAGVSGYFRDFVARPMRIVMIAGGLLLVLAETYPDWLRIAAEAAIMAALIAMPKLFAPNRPAPVPT